MFITNFIVCTSKVFGKLVCTDNFLYLCDGYKHIDNSMYRFNVESIPITNITDRDKEVIVKGNSITVKYGSMINRSFRIDVDMLSDILDSGDAAIKVFRYIKDHTNSQTNKVVLKSSYVVDCLRKCNIKADASIVSKGIAKLIKINFIMKANELEVYKHDASNVYLVDPNYCVISSPDIVFSRIQSDEREKHDNEIIFELDKKRLKREVEVRELRTKNKSKTNESKD